MSVPLQTPKDVVDNSSALTFFVQRILGQAATTCLVRVDACTNTDALAPVGFVDVTPLVGQVTGDGQVIPYKTVYGMPYQRIQGGANAVIIDPKAGDVGVAVICSRDISSVKKSKKQGPPGSARTFNISDGVYLGGVLNAAPVQYIRFSASGVEIVSPDVVTITAPTINLNGAVIGSSTAVFAGDVLAAGTSTHTHVHSDPQGGDVGPPI